MVGGTTADTCAATPAQRRATELAITGYGSERVPYLAACPDGCGHDVLWTGVRVTSSDDPMLARLELLVAPCPRAWREQIVTL